MRPPQDASSPPTGSLRPTLTGVVERFEEAWQQAPPEPDLGAFLPPQGELRRRALVELAHVDLEYRLKAGQAARVEDYLDRFPELANDTATLPDLIAAEHRLRCRREPALGVTEYLARFPQCREAILARLPSTAEVPMTIRTSPAAPAAPPTRVSSPPDTDAPGAAPPPFAPAGRYELGEAIGRGGMGEVLCARDPQLGRELAIKVLREDHGHPELLRRFVEEAQVCSQLQHPGIVPVHDLGTLPDGRPFFAMKLVRGRTLTELLRARVAPSDDLPRLLAVFEQVCQAVAYAHSKGVIHRDLKPGNVMVGAFGEVQVMDWGLAKVLRPHNGAAAGTAVSGVRTVRGACGYESREGQAMGTPAYMAPEQARGEVEGLDERCDVFGLGAILCEVLTGLPPFSGRSQNEALGRSMRADLEETFARLDCCGADAELLGLAKACLAAGAAARPRDAGAVAAAVTAYQRAVQERLRQAELGRAAEQARAEEAQATAAQERKAREAAQARARAERRARRVTVGLAMAMVAVMVLVVVGGLWWQRQQAAQRQDVEARLGQAVRLRQSGQFEEALGLLEQTRNRLGTGGPADLRAQVDRALADTGLAKRFDDARQRASTIADGKLDLAGAVRGYAAALAESGLAQEGEDAEAVAARLRASAVRAEVVAALDDWAGIMRDGPRRAWLLAVARAADPDPQRDRLRQPALWRDKAALARLAGEARAELSPQLAVALGRALGGGGDAVPLLREAQAHHPHDFWLNFKLGLALAEVKEWDEAIGYYRAALALRPRAVAVHNNLGIALHDKGRLDEAVAHYEQALRIDPKHTNAHYNLGITLHDKGQLDEAVAHYEQALRLDPKLVYAHNNLGNALEAKGRSDEAVAHYQQALRIDPKDPYAHVNLGNALEAKGRSDEAVGHYERAIALDPKLAYAHVAFGNTLMAKGRTDEAVAHFEEALRLDPKHAQAHFNLASALKDKGRLDEAVGHYERAIALGPKHAQAHNNLGNVLAAKGKLDEAVAHFEEALRLDPKHASAHYNLGTVLKAKGKLDEAVAHFEEALRLDPKLAYAHVNLGNALSAKGKLDEAVAHYEQALRLDPKLAQAHNNLGSALKDKGRLEEAVAHYQEALRINPRYANAHGGLGQALLALGRWAEARNATRRCLDLLPPRHPRRGPVTQQLQRCERMLALEARLPAVLGGQDRPDAAERLEFADLCRATKRYAAAARFSADAFAADPKLAGDHQRRHRYNAACCAALAATGHGPDAPQLGDKGRSRLRGQALGWLRADLALWQKQADSTKAEERAAAQQTLRHWQQAPDLAGVRDQEALAALPAEERAKWDKLWAEVAGLLRRIEAGKADAGPTRP
jgi:serine/threonine-protein kinase